MKEHNDAERAAHVGPAVLIVDGERDFAAAVVRELGRRGFDAVGAGNGREAIGLLGARTFDVVILGVAPPGAEGMEILREIRRERPKTPVVLLAGHGDETSAREALENGAFDYLCKPCDIDVLTGRIDDALLSRRIGRQAERRVTEIMIPIERYTCVQASCTVREGIEALRRSAESFVSSGLVMESGHRAVLVFEGDELVGVLTMRNLIQTLLPAHLLDDTGALSGCTKYSPLFWSGLFTARIPGLENRMVRDIMNPRAPVVSCEANLMQVAHLLCEKNRRRVAVEKDGRIIGVVREQELFHELSRQMFDGGRVS